MVANAGRRTRLNREAFERHARALFGDAPQYVIAAHLGLHPSVLSALLNGKRQPSFEFVAQLLATFEGATFDELVTYVPDNGHRVIAARIAAHTRWAKAEDRQAVATRGQRGLRARFAAEIDPKGELSAAERERRVDSMVKAHMTSLALKRHKGQRAA